MPRRNRNAGTPRPGADQLAVQVGQLMTELHLLTCGMPGTGKSPVLARYLARIARPGSLLVVIDGKQPIPHVTPGSR